MDLSYISQEAFYLKEKGRNRYLRCVSTPHNAVTVVQTFGMLKTTCRWGTFLSTWEQSHSPNSTTRF